MKKKITSKNHYNIIKKELDTKSHNKDFLENNEKLNVILIQRTTMREKKGKSEMYIKIQLDKEGKIKEAFREHKIIKNTDFYVTRLRIISSNNETTYEIPEEEVDEEEQNLKPLPKSIKQKFLNSLK